jgi:hypothetical protein
VKNQRPKIIIGRRPKMGDNLKDLEMAKKRDHKIMITDEAISKVPKYKNSYTISINYDNR